MTDANKNTGATSKQVREPSRELTEHELALVSGGSPRLDPYKAFKFIVHL
jgi:bacteriocin-like protein